jgi:hypothetical protein
VWGVGGWGRENIAKVLILLDNSNKKVHLTFFLTLIKKRIRKNILLDA